MSWPDFSIATGLKDCVSPEMGNPHEGGHPDATPAPPRHPAIISRSCEEGVRSQQPVVCEVDMSPTMLEVEGRPSNGHRYCEPNSR
jgi:arylsulfatase A-like enzyme